MTLGWCVHCKLAVRDETNVLMPISTTLNTWVIDSIMLHICYYLEGMSNMCRGISVWCVYCQNNGKRLSELKSLHALLISCMG